jgi:serine phosphatase RsbU (regulator of sigma subunit)
VSDGVLEAADRNDEEFGSERLGALIVETREQSPPVVVRRVTRAILDHRQQPLRDDATVVCLDWRSERRG